MKINTPSWMGDLGNKIGSCCLKDLTIPGSHDSGTYGMVLPGCAAHYANVYEQLRAGARYLDLRAMWNDNDYHMYHGNFTSLNKLSSVLDQIQQFLKENKNEVLILDFRLYPRKDKEELQERRDVWRDLNRRFAGQLVTRDLLRKVTAYDDARPSEWKQFHPGWLTFNDLWSSKQQILALTNDAVSAPLSYGAYEGETYIFPGSVDVLISFSADTNNPNVLLDSLDKNVSLVRNEPDPRLCTLEPR